MTLHSEQRTAIWVTVLWTLFWASLLLNYGCYHGGAEPMRPVVMTTAPHSIVKRPHKLTTVCQRQIMKTVNFASTTPSADECQDWDFDEYWLCLWVVQNRYIDDLTQDIFGINSVCSPGFEEGVVQ